MASRLCAACGLCCNGVLFQEVHLQPGDSIRAVAALGLRLKSRHGKRYFQQPCRAFRVDCCSIYDERPTRCREFACRQLRLVAAGDIDEQTALQTIAEARALVGRVEELIEQAGGTNVRKSLRKRFEKVTSEPGSVDLNDAAAGARSELEGLYAAMVRLLASEFRVEASN